MKYLIAAREFVIRWLLRGLMYHPGSIVIDDYRHGRKYIVDVNGAHRRLHRSE